MANFPMAAQIAPFRNLIEITAGASSFAETRGIFIETAGDFTIQMADASSAITLTLAVGTHPMCITKCTAGTGLFAGY